MSRQKMLEDAIALKTMETHAALTAQALLAQTESKVTRANYDYYQGHFKVMFDLFDYRNGRISFIKTKLYQATS